ncbi:NAD(P)H:quinone oxidoreductase type IV [Deinococcus peraridilitoris]|uniref:NAD(P)H:quinone oxidoreductase, type IV n=1 Tax=Deinococcus peraridilitoris (strain DSM 19664 / LMG 22246 / CIP 109416 / KR-200) TaxID=937777 RepID=L0A3S7_DEIPD|nr:NAD(P)H:quinone oxidoreductase type IV [Deinococcus peraridilitoris]AFZ68548.1 NAD(P)H:quinone oxidoreductase, type IV [Deinococcus peraridilitoris DSM 19664]
MPQPKLAIIYYSTYGTNYTMAQTAAEAARAAGAEVKVLKVRETAPPEVVQGQGPWAEHHAATAEVPEVTLNDLEWADAYLFSVPTRYGSPASQMRAFMDTTGGLWYQGKLANKAASVMTSAQNPNGGQETTLLAMYVSLMHWGCVLVPPGYTDQSVFAAGGNPYGVGVTANGEGPTEADLEAIRHQARRLVFFAQKISGSQIA